eukprot:m.204473 g.204473  ORF g.204473 m.204473 type:complete len:337 (-) comp15391_c0_seq1:3939-4949(-)
MIQAFLGQSTRATRQSHLLLSLATLGADLGHPLEVGLAGVSRGQPEHLGLGVVPERPERRLVVAVPPAVALHVGPVRPPERLLLQRVPEKLLQLVRFRGLGQRGQPIHVLQQRGHGRGVPLEPRHLAGLAGATAAGRAQPELLNRTPGRDRFGVKDRVAEAAMDRLHDGVVAAACVEQRLDKPAVVFVREQLPRQHGGPPGHRRRRLVREACRGPRRLVDLEQFLLLGNLPREAVRGGPGNVWARHSKRLANDLKGRVGVAGENATRPAVKPRDVVAEDRHVVLQVLVQPFPGALGAVVGGGQVLEIVRALGVAAVVLEQPALQPFQLVPFWPRPV